MMAGGGEYAPMAVRYIVAPSASWDSGTIFSSRTIVIERSGIALERFGQVSLWEVQGTYCIPMSTRGIFKP
jgi:hypothetical protein